MLFRSGGGPAGEELGDARVREKEVGRLGTGSGCGCYEEEGRDAGREQREEEEEKKREKDRVQGHKEKEKGPKCVVGGPKQKKKKKEEGGCKVQGGRRKRARTGIRVLEARWAWAGLVYSLVILKFIFLLQNNFGN